MRAHLAHRVKIFTTKDAAPASIPVSPIIIDVPAQSPSVPRREIDLALPEPLTIAPGDDLVVAVQMTGTCPDVSCLVSRGGSADVGRSFWGSGDAPPHDWKRLSSFGLDSAYMSFAYGNE